MNIYTVLWNNKSLEAPQSAMLFAEPGANWCETAIYKQFISLPVGFWEGKNRYVWKEGVALLQKVLFLWDIE